jgi:NAD(P)-dependent dehydrogenase (short-subunit alcohol dehydrogenase family)
MLRDDALKGRTIVITGGGTGLGKAMGTYFLQLGANLVITSRKLDVIEQTARELETLTGGKVLAVACDVREYSQVEHVLEESIKAFGKVDSLINNAAGNFISPTERLSANAFSSIIDIVLKDQRETSRQYFKYHHDIRIYRVCLCGAVCLRKGWCAGHDAVIGRGMGQVWDPHQRDRTRSISNERRMGTLVAGRSRRKV